MRYDFYCVCGNEFETTAPIAEGPPPEVLCPNCDKPATRLYEMSTPIWNTDGSSKDYFKESPGRGQSLDKKEWLRQKWSDTHNGAPPPPEDSIGTYDGIPRPGQVIKKKST